MAQEPRFTLQTALVIDALLANPGACGSELTKFTKLSSGSLYPILIRLEQAGWLESEWEEEAPTTLGRPRRRNYSVTKLGAAKARSLSRAADPVFRRLAWT
jgi:PadR family transcriptional regulator, regulatory protein PadR